MLGDTQSPRRKIRCPRGRVPRLCRNARVRNFGPLAGARPARSRAGSARSSGLIRRDAEIQSRPQRRDWRFRVSLKGGLAAPALPVSGSESPLIADDFDPARGSVLPDAIPGAAEASGLGTLLVEAYAAQVVPGSDGKDKSPEDVNDRGPNLRQEGPGNWGRGRGRRQFRGRRRRRHRRRRWRDGHSGAADPSSPLNHFYPRVVFVQDVLARRPPRRPSVHGKALERGVHVVF